MNGQKKNYVQMGPIDCKEIATLLYITPDMSVPNTVHYTDLYSAHNKDVSVLKHIYQKHCPFKNPIPWFFLGYFTLFIAFWVHLTCKFIKNMFYRPRENIDRGRDRGRGRDREYYRQT
jgi:hypothetical protein